MTNAEFHEGALDAFWDAVRALVASTDDGSGRGWADYEFMPVVEALNAVQVDLGLAWCGRKLVVTCAGDLERAGAVLQVVDSLPADLRGQISVGAFMPRAEAPEKLLVHANGQVLSMSDIRFALNSPQIGDLYELTVHVPGFVESARPDAPQNYELANEVSLVLDMLCGEWSVMSQVGSVLWRGGAVGAGLRPLSELPLVLDRARERSFVGLLTD